MNIQRDTKGQPFIEWEQAPGGYKRAWIQRKAGSDKDWANTPEGRYLNVVRIEQLGEGPAGNATDFPIYSNLSDEQILEAFVASVSAITGCRLPQAAGATQPRAPLDRACSIAVLFNIGVARRWARTLCLIRGKTIVSSTAEFNTQIEELRSVVSGYLDTYVSKPALETITKEFEGQAHIASIGNLILIVVDSIKDHGMDYDKEYLTNLPKEEIQKRIETLGKFLELEEISTTEDRAIALS